MDKQAIIAEAWRKARYAYNSYDMRLMYEAHGYVKGIVDAGIVTYHEVADIDSFICRDSLNNGKWCMKLKAGKWKCIAVSLRHSGHIKALSGRFMWVGINKICIVEVR